MLLQVGGSYNHKIIPFLSRANIKSLNVVLDLNGILCVCQEKRLMPKSQAYKDGLTLKRQSPVFGPFLYNTQKVLHTNCTPCKIKRGPQLNRRVE